MCLANMKLCCSTRKTRSTWKQKSVIDSSVHRIPHLNGNLSFILITSFSSEWSSSENASTKKTSVTRLACTEDQRREVWLEMGGRPKGENLSSTVETWQSTWLERGWCCSVSGMGSVHRQIQGRKGYSRPSKVEDEFQVCVECFAWY